MLDPVFDAITNKPLPEDYVQQMPPLPITDNDKLDAAKAALDAVMTPVILEEAERTYRVMSAISAEELLRPFTI